MAEQERVWAGTLIGVAALAAYFPSQNDLFIAAGVLLIVVSLLAGSGLVRLKAGLSGFEAEFAEQLQRKAKDLGSASSAAGPEAANEAGNGQTFTVRVAAGESDVSTEPDGGVGAEPHDPAVASQVVVGHALAQIANAIMDGRPAQAAEEVAQSVRRAMYAGQVFAASDLLVDYAIATDPPESLREWERDMQHQTIAGLSSAELNAVRQWRADHEVELARFRNARDGIARGTGWTEESAEEAAKLGWWLATDAQLRLGRVHESNATG